MKIISFEGIDKSGKHTLSCEMANSLIAKGFTVVQDEFHRYDTPTGQLIYDYLHGTYDVPQSVIELIMAADKLAQKKYFEQLEADGVDFLILDRYLFSQFAYSQALLTLAPEDDYREMGLTTCVIARLLGNLMPPSDYVVYCDVSPETSMSRKGQHGENDKYESNHLLLSTVCEEYKIFAEHPKKKEIWHCLDCEKPMETVKEELEQWIQTEFALGLSKEPVAID